MNEVTVRTNLPDFRRQLAELDARVGKRYIRRSASAAAAVFRGLARKKAPILADEFKKRKGRNRRFAGALRRGIYIRRNGRRAARGIEVYSVTVKGSVRFGKDGTADPFYWRWQEAGWAPRGPGRRLRGGTRSRRLQRERNRAAGATFVPGRWFMRDAAREGKDAAVDAFFRRMDESFRSEPRR